MSPEPAAARALAPARVSKAPLRVGAMHVDGGAAFVAMVKKEWKDHNGDTCDALYRWSDRDRLDAWAGLDGAKNLQSKFSAALCVYWALVHRTRESVNGGKITWNTPMPEGRKLMEEEKARTQVEGSAKRSSYDVVRAYVTAKVEREAAATRAGAGMSAGATSADAAPSAGAAPRPAAVPRASVVPSAED